VASAEVIHIHQRWQWMLQHPRGRRWSFRYVSAALATKAELSASFPGSFLSYGVHIDFKVEVGRCPQWTNRNCSCKLRARTVRAIA
jgi:hypothetical protein